MQMITALLAVAGLAVAAPAADGDPAYAPPHGYEKPTPKCETTSTCSAVYKTTTKSIPYELTKTITITSYQPETYTTGYEKNWTVTSYVPTSYNITKTVPTTSYITCPASSLTTICTTSTVSWNTTSISTGISYSTCPESSSYPTTETKYTWVPSTITTDKPVPITTTSLCPETSTTVCTETESQCTTATSCKTPPAAPTYEAPSPKYEPPKTYQSKA